MAKNKGKGNLGTLSKIQNDAKIQKLEDSLKDLETQLMKQKKINNDMSKELTQSKSPQKTNNVKKNLGKRI